MNCGNNIDINYLVDKHCSSSFNHFADEEFENNSDVDKLNEQIDTNDDAQVLSFYISNHPTFSKVLNPKDLYIDAETYERYLELFNKIKYTNFKNIPYDIVTFIRLIFSHVHEKILECISNVFSNDKNRDALRFIRASSDIEFDPTLLNSIVPSLFYKFNKIFIASRKLLLYAFVDQYMKRSPIQGDLIQSEDFTMELSGVKFEMKKSGAQFGGIITDTTSNKVYYVKAHQNYPFKNKEWKKYVTEYQKAENERDPKNDDDFIYIEEDRVITPDLKEPFTYKVLESLNLGPKVDFLINPYIYGGFYIVSESLTNDEYSFVDMNYMVEEEFSSTIRYLISDFIKKVKSPNIISPEEFKTHFSNKALEGLTTVDIIYKIFSLNDAHQGNFGYIIQGIPYRRETACQPSDVEQRLAVDFLQNRQDFKIIDFIPSHKGEEKYIIPKIEGRYLVGDVDIYPREFFLMRCLFMRLTHEENHYYDDQYEDPFVFAPRNDNVKREKFYFGYRAFEDIQRRIDEATSSQSQNLNKDSDSIESFRLLLLQKANEIKSLMKLRRNDLPFLRKRTNASLLGFMSRNGDERAKDEKLQLNYIEDAFEDLDNYVNGILENFKNLKKFISDGYNEFFDENGNLRPYSTEEISNNKQSNPSKRNIKIPKLVRPCIKRKCFK